MDKPFKDLGEKRENRGRAVIGKALKIFYFRNGYKFSVRPSFGNTLYKIEELSIW